jgi:integrase
MTTLDRYLSAAERANTRRSYRAALRHFEETWGGFLPASSEAVARYLAEHAEQHAPSTLKLRLAALARWHQDHGFADPAKSPLVRQVLKGIATLHRAPTRQAAPLTLEILSAVDAVLAAEIASSRAFPASATHRRALRDRTLLLLGFWRGFRSDELIRLRVEHITAVPGEGMDLFLPHTKADRQASGTRFQAPALPLLCPVQAYSDWIAAAGLSQGPVFRRIARDATLAAGALNPLSLIPLLRRRLRQAGIPDPERYSGHSARRGFATWASEHGWDLKDLMTYVGWKNPNSAMRYIERSNPYSRERFERALGFRAPALTEAPTQVLECEVSLHLERYNSRVRTLTKTRRYIERACFMPFAMVQLDPQGTRYRLSVPYSTPEALDEMLHELIDEMHRIAADNQCFIEVTLRDTKNRRVWD